MEKGSEICLDVPPPSRGALSNMILGDSIEHMSSTFRELLNDGKRKVKLIGHYYWVHQLRNLGPV